ncbi:MAG: hypothetical protein Q8P24_09375 [Desulfobacterales bacterium]|nr:hypothetical protein [Desulfobacterales bacterium]
MNKKQRQTLQKVFEKPERADISWNDIEGLFTALGAEVTEGKGSRVGWRLMKFVLFFTDPILSELQTKGL